MYRWEGLSTVSRLIFPLLTASLAVKFYNFK